MSDFWLYFKLGLEHVLDWNAYDHVLFLIALSAAYPVERWRRLLILVTLFTVGHTLSLLITNYTDFRASESWVEFLIPVSIAAAALYNIIRAQRSEGRVSVIYGVTLFFGLVHGFGFGRYFVQINDEQQLLPLLEFALGIEVSQVIVVVGVLLLGTLLTRFGGLAQRDWILVASGAVLGLCIPMLVENWIF